ncbi:hypothetical protein YPPY19_1578, partial [Yersinia pestis PY-19]
MGKATFCPI